MHDRYGDVQIQNLTPPYRSRGESAIDLVPLAHLCQTEHYNNVASSHFVIVRVEFLPLGADGNKPTDSPSLCFLERLVGNLRQLYWIEETSDSSLALEEHLASPCTHFSFKIVPFN